LRTKTFGKFGRLGTKTFGTGAELKNEKATLATSGVQQKEFDAINSFYLHSGCSQNLCQKVRGALRLCRGDFTNVQGA